jgi:hypothetical protein
MPFPHALVLLPYLQQHRVTSVHEIEALSNMAPRSKDKPFLAIGYL